MVRLPPQRQRSSEPDGLMAAAEKVSPVQFFHGTNVDFGEGDEVVHGKGAVHGDENDRVWVASNAWVASAYGARTYEVTPHAPPKKRNKAGEFHTTGATVKREMTKAEIVDAGNSWWEHGK